jgi:hypothetical protein
MNSLILTIHNPQSEAELQTFLASHPDIQVEQWDSEPDDAPENNPELLASLEVARKQIENGEYVTREQLNQEIAKRKDNQNVLSS